MRRLSPTSKDECESKVPQLHISIYFSVQPNKQISLAVPMLLDGGAGVINHSRAYCSHWFSIMHFFINLQQCVPSFSQHVFSDP